MKLSNQLMDTAWYSHSNLVRWDHMLIPTKEVIKIWIKYKHKWSTLLTVSNRNSKTIWSVNMEKNHTLKDGKSSKIIAAFYLKNKEWKNLLRWCHILNSQMMMLSEASLFLHRHVWFFRIWNGEPTIRTRK